MIRSSVLSILAMTLVVGSKASDLSRAELPVGLSVKFGVGLNWPQRSFFFQIPLNISQAKSEGWYENEKPEGPDYYKELVLLCFENCQIGALYEPHSTYVAGLQIGISKRNFTGQAYDMNVNGWTDWTTTIDGKTEELYTITQYYMSGVFLSKSPEDRISSYNTSVILQEGYVYAPGPHGTMMTMSANGTVVRTESLFTQQSCIWWMGTHYYYNMSATTECTAEQIAPWFLLIHGDDGEKQDTIGLCMMTFGKMPIVSGLRDPFERPDRTAVQAIVSSGPSCLYDLADDGVITCHVYFTSSPQSIFC